MQRWLVVVAFVMVSGLGLAGLVHAADECCVGGQCFSESGFPYDADDICPGGDLCGCTIDGNNCEVTLTEDASTSSGDCLTLGDGVTLDMNGHTISCTDDDCGLGIKNTDSDAGGAKVVIKNGKIEGCFDGAVRATGGVNATVDGLDIDMDTGTTCAAGGVIVSLNPSWVARIGVVGIPGNVTDTQVRDAGIGMLQGGSIVDSVVRNNGIGLVAPSATLDVFGMMFLENGVHIRPFTVNTQTPDVQESAFVLAGTCNCTDIDDVCQDIEDCVVFKGSAPNFVCVPSEDGSRVCSFH